MKPLSPIDPTKLPIVYLLTIAKDDDKKEPWFNVVLTKMRGDAVLKRTVLQPAEPSMDLALDAFNRFAYRAFYFREAEDML